MKKTLLTYIIVIILTIPSFADIASDAVKPSCDTNVLGITNGTVNLRADWSANQINLTWYNDVVENNGEVVGTTQCTYNQGITLPSINPTKFGYTFSGWRVRPQQCDFSGVDYENADVYITYAFIRHNGDFWGCKLIGQDPQNPMEGCAAAGTAATYGLSQPGDWGITFDYGKVKGTSSCNMNSGGMDGFQGGSETEYLLSLFGPNGAAIKPSSEFNSNSTGIWCWCKVTKYTPTIGQSCNLNGQWLALPYTHNSNQDCARGCAGECIDGILSPFYRQLLFQQS